MRRVGYVVATAICGLGLVVATMLGGWGAQAEAQSTGSISGTVTNAALQGLDQILVCANNFSFTNCTRSMPDGSYVVGDLPASSYFVEFIDTTGLHIREFYDSTTDFTTRTMIDVTDGNDTPGIDASLEVGGGRISGRVTEQVTGASLSGISVCVSRSSGAFFCSGTEADGTYAMIGLPPGDHVVVFSDRNGPFIEQYWQQASSSATATPVSVGLGESVAGIDAALSQGGSIAGVVSDVNSNPLGGVRVCANNFQTNTCTSSQGDGSYTLAGLVPGSYFVEFIELSSTYVREFYDSTTDFSNRTMIDVNGQAVGGIDATLETGASEITGVVTGPGGIALQGIRACIYYPFGEFSCGFTSATGEYAIFGLMPGSYTVKFTDDSGTYFAEFFDDAASEAGATQVVVPADTNVTNINAELSDSQPPAICQPGTFSPTGNEPCTLAPAGSFVAESGATAAVLCGPGRFSAVAGSTACDLAPAGSFVADEGATAADPCLPGRFSAVAGSTGCDLAPAGSFVAGEGAAEAVLCAAGSFAAAAGSTACDLASAGSFVAGEGAAEAVLCSAGSFAAVAGSTACDLASAGSFVADEGASASLLCGLGSFAAVAGLSECVLAPAGSFVADEGATEAVLCAAGSFAAEAGSTGCDLAPAGSFVSDEGATEAEPCPAGTTSGTAGATECEPNKSCDGRTVTIDMNANGGNGMGTAGDDVILGTPGDDLIDAGAGDDVVCAGDGADVVVGGDGADRLFGEDGRDILRGNAGVDHVDGGAGNDRVLGGIDGDTLIGGDGDDYLGGFGGADIIMGGPGNETIFGGFGADTIDGGDGDDEIFGLVGDDVINGGAGNDELNGDRGNDTINGGDGDDVIRGGNANDVLNGDAGDDSVNGGKADDQLSGGAGANDTCVGNKETIADTADATCELIFGVP